MPEVYVLLSWVLFRLHDTRKYYMETYNLFDHKYKAHIIVCWQYLVSTSHSILSSRWILIGISIMELANILMLHLINFLG